MHFSGVIVELHTKSLTLVAKLRGTYSILKNSHAHSGFTSPELLTCCEFSSEN